MNFAHEGRPSQLADLSSDYLQIISDTYSVFLSEQHCVYQYLYGDTLEHVAFQRSCSARGCPNSDGAEIADWMWDVMSHRESPSLQSPSNPGGGAPDDARIDRFALGAAAAPASYSLFQFRDLEGMNTGVVNAKDGVVCSTLLAYAHFMSGKGTVLLFVYPHAQLVSGVDGLLGAVEAECNQGIGFWKGIGATLTCFEGVCDDAARQVANCMAVGRCDTDSDGANSFASVRSDASATATSISPDRLGGWSGHPWQGYVDGTEGSGVSVWAGDDEQEVQWNAPGNVYGCWF